MSSEPAVSPWPPWARGIGGDVALSFVLAAFQLVGTHFAAEGQPEREALDALARVLLVAGPLLLLLRRRRPGVVLVGVFAITVSYLALGYPFGPVFFSLFVASFTAVLAGRRTWAWTATAVGYVAFLVLGHGADDGATLAEAAGLAAWMIVPLIAAEVARSRRERAAELTRSRAEEERRRAGEERMRIARELHDVVAHNMSLINVQASVALHLADERPEQARTALAAIKEASKEGLDELRSVLDLLRGTGEEAPLRPAPGLDDLHALVARAEGAGVAVHMETEGVKRPVPAAVGLAGFRMVQEGLTNVVRHAGPATAVVTLAYGDDDLVVQVDDDGAGPVDGAGGVRGITGMGERVGALGGHLDAGPLPGRGFRLRARFPLDRQP